MESIAGNILVHLITMSPQILVGAMGLVLVRSRIKESFPKARFHGSVGFSLLLLNGLLITFSRVYMISYAGEVVSMANTVTAINALGFVILAAALVFLLLAVLADRDPVPAR